MFTTRSIIVLFYFNYCFSDPNVTVSIVGSVATPVAGSMYSLTCTVTGAERLTGSNITYQWFKNGTAVSGQIMETLFFTSLSSNDVGGYTCQATVISSLLSQPIITSQSSLFSISLTGEFVYGCYAINVDPYSMLYIII